MEWVSIKDKLPKEECEVTVYIVDNNLNYIGDGCYDAFFDEDEFYDPKYCKYKLYGVTHWVNRIKKPTR